MLSRFVIASLPRSKRLLISWSQSSCAVILELKRIKSVTVSIFPHLFAMKWWDRMPWSWFFECWVLSQVFHSLLSSSSIGSLVSLHFLPLEWYHMHIWVADISPGDSYSSLWVIQLSILHDLLFIMCHFIGHELEQIPRHSEGQRSMACCSPCQSVQSVLQFAKSQTQLSDWTTTTVK